MTRRDMDADWLTWADREGFRWAKFNQGGIPLRDCLLVLFVVVCLILARAVRPA